MPGTIAGIAGIAVDKSQLETELIEAFRKFLEALYPYIKISAEHCAKNISKTVMQKVLDFVNEENKFSVYDERIYDYYYETMRSYNEIAKLYDENFSEIDDLMLSEILHGIRDVVFAKVREFEEYRGVKFSEEQGERVINPIRAEKALIIKQIYDNLNRSLKTVEENILSSPSSGGYFEENRLKAQCFNCAYKTPEESHLDFYTFMYQGTLEKGGLDIYKIYSGTLVDCAQKINNLDSRRQASYYYDALIEENENLNSIAKVQLSALSDIEADISETERRISDKIVELIKSAHAEDCRHTEEIEAIINETKNTPAQLGLMNFDEFLNDIEVKGLCSYLEKTKSEGLETLESGTLSAVCDWKSPLDTFMTLFDGLTGSMSLSAFDTKPYKKFLYEMRKRITDKLILTDEMIESFKLLQEVYEQNKDVFPNDGYLAIINGIQESIGIKLDILNESKASFEAEAKEKLDGYVPPELTNEDIRFLAQERLLVWQEHMLPLDASDIHFSEKARAASEKAISEMGKITANDQYDDRMNRKISKETDKIIKMENAYLRDFVLFEMGTFEEILTYSVSKLRESENETVKLYAESCDSRQKSLIKLLKRHGILVISPEPFEQFNSQEHEVLVAEKNENYKKGQIIKLMNSGFKYDETVLVRANVIAAK